jgi:hypothetical protein
MQIKLMKRKIIVSRKIRRIRKEMCLKLNS